MTNRDPRFAELDAAIAQLPRERTMWLGSRQAGGRRQARAEAKWRDNLMAGSQTERRRAYLIETGRLDLAKEEGLL